MKITRSSGSRRQNRHFYQRPAGKNAKALHIDEVALCDINQEKQQNHHKSCAAIVGKQKKSTKDLICDWNLRMCARYCGTRIMW
ncbi:MAG: hypothetical protein ACLU3U_09035 [Gallintestinimicrobium sp.]